MKLPGAERLGSTTFTNSRANDQLLGQQIKFISSIFQNLYHRTLGRNPFSLLLFQFNEMNSPARRPEGPILHCCSRRAWGVLQSSGNQSVGIYPFQRKLSLISLERGIKVSEVLGADLRYHEHFKGCEFSTLV